MKITNSYNVHMFKVLKTSHMGKKRTENKFETKNINRFNLFCIFQSDENLKLKTSIFDQSKMVCSHLHPNIRYHINSN